MVALAEPPCETHDTVPELHDFLPAESPDLFEAAHEITDVDQIASDVEPETADVDQIASDVEPETADVDRAAPSVEPREQDRTAAVVGTKRANLAELEGKTLHDLREMAKSLEVTGYTALPLAATIEPGPSTPTQMPTPMPDTTEDLAFTSTNIDLMSASRSGSIA